MFANESVFVRECQFLNSCVILAIKQEYSSTIIMKKKLGFYY